MRGQGKTQETNKITGVTLQYITCTHYIACHCIASCKLLYEPHAVACLQVAFFITCFHLEPRWMVVNMSAHPQLTGKMSIKLSRTLLHYVRLCIRMFYWEKAPC